MRFPFRSFFAFAVLASLVATAPIDAVAEEHTVSMTGKAFSPTALRIQAGDTIRFVNDDSVTHDIYSLTQGHLFTSGRRAPGNRQSASTASSTGSASRFPTVRPRFAFTRSTST